MRPMAARSQAPATARCLTGMTAYRDELEALEARHTSLTQEAKAAAAERDHAKRMLEEVRARARLPVLDNIRLATPCTAAWSEMSGDDRVRHCGACKKDVFNLSELTRDEARALILEKAGQLCVKYYQRHDGTILLADCTIGVHRRRRRGVIAAGAAAALFAAVGTGALMIRRSDLPAAVPRSQPAERTAGVVAHAPPARPRAFVAPEDHPAGGLSIPPEDLQRMEAEAREVRAHEQKQARRAATRERSARVPRATHPPAAPKPVATVTHGYVTVATSPPGLVSINGKATDLGEDNKIALPPGQHRLTITAGGEAFSYSIKVNPGETTRFEKTLPLRAPPT